MSRPINLIVDKMSGGDCQLTFIDELSGSATGCRIPANGYAVLRQHFKTGAMDISSDELSNCNIDNVVVSFCPKCNSKNVKHYNTPSCECKDCKAYWAV